MTHDLTPTIAFYDEILTGATDDRSAVGWRVSYAQDVAFLSLARVEGLRAGVRVLDVGCGLGGLLGFFERSGLQIDYTGIDINDKMIAGARQRHPRARFEVRDVLNNPPRERYDFVMCSGALGLRMPRHQAYMMEMIATMYGLCDVALAFNMLSAYELITKPALQAATPQVAYEWPEQILQFCKTQSEYVALAHDTDAGMFSVFVYRQHRSALERFLAHVKPGTSYDRGVRAAIDYHIELGMWAELRTFLGGIAPCAAVSYFLGLAGAALGDAAQAEAAFRAAIDAEPSSPWAYIQLGYLFSRQGDLTRARAAAQHGLELAPREPEAHQALIKILFAHNQIAEARAAAAAMPDGLLADTLRATFAEAPSEAIGLLDRALAAAPGYLPALVQKAALLERTGQLSGAIETLRAAQRIAPVDRSIANRIEALIRTQAKEAK